MNTAIPRTSRSATLLVRDDRFLWRRFVTIPSLICYSLLASSHEPMELSFPHPSDPARWWLLTGPNGKAGEVYGPGFDAAI